MWQETHENISSQNINKTFKNLRLKILEELEVFCYPKDEPDFFDICKYVVRRVKHDHISFWAVRETLIALQALKPVNNNAGIPFYFVLRDDYPTIKEVEEWMEKLKNPAMKHIAALRAVGIPITDSNLGVTYKDYDFDKQIFMGQYKIPEWAHKYIVEEHERKKAHIRVTDDTYMFSAIGTVPTAGKNPMGRREINGHFRKADVITRSKIGEKLIKRHVKSEIPPHAPIRYCSTYMNEVYSV